MVGNLLRWAQQTSFAVKKIQIENWLLHFILQNKITIIIQKHEYTL